MANAMSFEEKERYYDGPFRMAQPHTHRIAQAAARLRTEAATVRQCIANYRQVRTADFAAGFEGRPEALADWHRRTDVNLREARVFYRCAQVSLRQLRGELILPDAEPSKNTYYQRKEG
jgi:hypothetical protein